MTRDVRLLHGSRPAHVYERLREQIRRGRLAAGRRIIEADIAGALGVSRTPVRSALRTLMRDGYVVATGQGRQVRLQVAPLRAADLSEIFQLLGALEGSAARAAAALPPARRRALAAALRRDTRALEAAFRQRPPNYDRRLTLHRRFHERLVHDGGQRWRRCGRLREGAICIQKQDCVQTARTKSGRQPSYIGRR